MHTPDFTVMYWTLQQRQMCDVCIPLALQDMTGKSQAVAVAPPPPHMGRYHCSARCLSHVNLLQARWQSVDR